jgi:hypothetical protein
MGFEEAVKKVLDYLEDQKVFVRPEAIQIVRGTKGGFNIYLNHYVIFVNIERNSILVKPRGALDGGKSRGKKDDKSGVSTSLL